MNTPNVIAPERNIILSGYFNPLHGGHMDMIEAAAKIGKVIVIVNNDKQQLLKKGKIILDEKTRLRIISSLKQVDEAILSIDDDPTVNKTLKLIASKKQNLGATAPNLVFANGGDRTNKNIAEHQTCEECGIKLLFNVGGEKTDSSSRIIFGMAQDLKA